VQSEQPEGLHLAIIMDGNGRWAARRGLPRVAGHRAGVRAVRRVVEHAPACGIRQLTLYAFSSDNWNRPLKEVRSIFQLMRVYLRRETRSLIRRGVRFEVIGRRDRLPNLLLREIAEAESATAGGRRLHLRIALDYSSRDAIARAATSMARACGGDPPPSLERVRAMLDRALTREPGDVDLLLRTGGEKRLSDFLLWESAYAELLFTDVMWPDFDGSELEAALAEFRLRERRFGALSSPLAHARMEGAR
jgi:undecaprenyl diphosphate synthase